MHIRRLTEQGVSAFSEYLERLRNGSTEIPPNELLEDEECSEAIDSNIEPPAGPFATRHALGVALSAALQNEEAHELLSDTGVWNWLALYYFDSLCPATEDGQRPVRDDANYIVSTNYGKRPRHAIRTTFQLVSKYPENSAFLLSNPLHTRGDLLEQFAARQFYISCEGVMKVASKLYTQPNGSPVRGATSRNRGGSMRRYIAFLQQIELTYDLFAIKSEALLDMLPAEFNDFVAGD